METREPNTLRAVELTRALGHSILIVNSERARPAEREAQWRLLVERFVRMCQKAEACGVVLAVEPEPGLLVHGMTDFARLKSEVGSPCVKLNLDVGHCRITDDVPSAIRTWAADLVHVHFEDIPGTVHRHLVPGDGDMDLAGIAAALRAASYRGYVTIDLFQIADDPERHARRAFEAARRILRAGG